MRRRYSALLTAFLFMSALIVTAEPSGPEPESVICGITETMEEPVASGAEQRTADLIGPLGGEIGMGENPSYAVPGEGLGEVDPAAAGLPQEMDVDLIKTSPGDELPVDSASENQGMLDEQAVGLEPEGETEDDALDAKPESSDRGGAQADPAQGGDSQAGIHDGHAPDQPEPCHMGAQSPVDELGAVDLKVSTILDPLRLVRLPDGCRLEGDILLTVHIKNMSSENLRVSAVPVFDEKTRALYTKLGISIDQGVAEFTLNGGGEQSLSWRFTPLGEGAAALDPSMIEEQDLAFQLRIAVEADRP